MASLRERGVETRKKNKRERKLKSKRQNSKGKKERRLSSSPVKMSGKEVVSHSLPPSDESNDNEEASDSDSEDEEEGDLREYGLAPSLPTTTAEAFAFEPGDGGDGDDDGEIVVDESEGFSAALRYLASVRLEAKTVPQIVVAEQPREREEEEEERETSSTADRPSSPPLSSRPTSSASTASDAVSLADPWLQAFLDDFSELRRAVTEAREVEHKDAWRLGAVEGKKRTGEEGDGEQLPRSWRAALGLSREEEEEQQQQPRRSRNPGARFLASLPQPEIVEALECVAEAVREFLEEAEEDEEEAGEGEKEAGEEEEEAEEKEAGEGESAPVVITPAVALWTFSLAANLERPVPPHASAALSALGKAAGAEARRRRRGRTEKKGEERAAAAAAAEEDDKASPPPPPSFLAASSPCPHAAVVAAICGAYFVQCEELSGAAKEGWP